MTVLNILNTKSCVFLLLVILRVNCLNEGEDNYTVTLDGNIAARSFYVGFTFLNRQNKTNNKNWNKYTYNFICIYIYYEQSSRGLGYVPE